MEKRDSLSKRVMFCINKKQEEQLKMIKKNEYYDKTSAEMMRDIIELGLAAYNAKIKDAT